MRGRSEHGVIEQGMEAHLSGSAGPEFYAHLDECPECRAEVESMEKVSEVLHALRSLPDCPEPVPGFYIRVAAGIEQQNRGRAWGLFSLSPAFFQRVAFASLLLIAGLGSFLVSRESTAGETDAVALIAQLPADTAANSAARQESAEPKSDRLLIALVNYGE